MSDELWHKIAVAAAEDNQAVNPWIVAALKRVLRRRRRKPSDL